MYCLPLASTFRYKLLTNNLVVCITRKCFGPKNGELLILLNVIKHLA